MFYSLTLSPTLYDLTLAGESQSASHIENLDLPISVGTAHSLTFYVTVTVSDGRVSVREY